MASVNKVILIGNLTRDPEVRYTPKGNAVTDIGLAMNRYYTLDSGEKREETTFVDVVLWGRQAELAGQYLSKGRPVYIEGRLQLDSWDDKQTGQKRSKLRVVGETMQFLGSRQDSEGGGSGGQRQQAQPAAAPAAAAAAAPAAATAPAAAAAAADGGGDGGGGASSDDGNDGAQFDVEVDEEDDIPF